jgi:hypothetical protein
MFALSFGLPEWTMAPVTRAYTPASSATAEAIFCRRFPASSRIKGSGKTADALEAPFTMLPSALTELLRLQAFAVTP